MTRLTRVITSTLVIGWISWICSVESFCRVEERELFAYSNPDTEHFHDEYTKFITSDKGEECKWIIMSSDDEEVVKLSFPVFDIKNTTGSHEGDCVKIYDGKTTDASVLDRLCDRRPGEYTSDGRYLLVVYERGEVEGKRGFTMTYYSKSVLTKAKIIRIAGIVGAALAVLGLTYVIFRATKCCSCLRGKNSSGASNLRSSTRERDRLTQVVVEDTDNATNQNPSERLTTPSNTGGVSPSASHNGTTANDGAHESDTDSLQDMNEPPPSYESLYLNEQGEPVTPPKYSPPQHRTTHPPRRVHTFN